MPNVSQKIFKNCSKFFYSQDAISGINKQRQELNIQALRYPSAKVLS